MVVLALPSPTGDDIAESMLAMTHCRYRATLVTALLSLANDDTAELMLVMA
jgi:hypothetical protein